LPGGETGADPEADGSKHVKDERDFNNIKTRVVMKYFSLQGKAPKDINVILTEPLVCLLPGRAKDLSAPLYMGLHVQCPGFLSYFNLLAPEIFF